MASDSFFLRFSWGPRKEALEQCADRLRRFLVDIGAVDPTFTAWRNGRRAGENIHFPPNMEQLQRLLAEGVNRKDIGNEIMPDLGFSVSLLAAEDDTAMTLGMHCGVYSHWNRNVCSIVFPTDGKVADRILQTSVLTAIAKAVVRNWEPEYGVITSHHCSKLTSPKSFETEAGWVTYLSPNSPKLPAIPKPAMVESVDHGELVISTNDRFSSGNPEHVKTVQRLSLLFASNS